MDVLIGMAVFVVFPIVAVIAIGRYFGGLQKRTGAKTYEEVKTAMSPRSFKIYSVFIVLLAGVIIVGRLYNLHQGGEVECEAT